MSKKKCATKVPSENGNTKGHSHPKKLWAFTLNNYTDQDLINVPEMLNHLCTKWVFGIEKGEEKEIPHLQGQLTLKKKKRLTALKKLDIRIHWEPTRNEDASVDYCKKEGKVFTNEIQKSYGKWESIKWKNWQCDILNLIKTEANDRTVHWYWENKGNTGKSFLTKYLVEVKNALVVNGKLADICHQVAKRCEDNIGINIVIIDVPRCSRGLISYQAIEMLKNGLIYSGKYEGGQYTFDSPHVIIFANQEPTIEMLSIDRWDIVRID